MVRNTTRVPVKSGFINLLERIRQTVIGCDRKWSQTPTGGRRCLVIIRPEQTGYERVRAHPSQSTAPPLSSHASDTLLCEVAQSDI